MKTNKKYFGYLDALLMQYYHEANEYKEDIQKKIGIMVTRDKWKVNQKVHDACMKKLGSDVFIKTNFSGEQFITFEGVIFYQNGGYKQQQNDVVRERHLKSVQAWAIAIGTSLAGIYAIVQLCLIYYHWYC